MKTNATDGNGNTALHAAALGGKASLVRLLLDSESFSGACLQNAQGRTALHCAAEQGSGDVANMLLGSGRFTDGAVNALAREHMPWKWAEHNVTTEDGFTALHVAAKFGHVSVAKALLEAERFRHVNAATSQASLLLPFTSPQGMDMLGSLRPCCRKVDALMP